MPTSYHISENRMYPMLKAEQDLVAFLLSLDRQFGGFERGLLSSLSKQRNENGIPVISVKQRVSLWKIPKRFHIPEIENFQHKEILEVVIFLMVAINSVHDSCWGCGCPWGTSPRSATARSNRCAVAPRSRIAVVPISSRATCSG